MSESCSAWWQRGRVFSPGLEYWTSGASVLCSAHLLAYSSVVRAMLSEAVWLALVPELNAQGKPVLEVAAEAVGTWLTAMAGFAVLFGGWAKWREANLQALRTSTSVSLHGGYSGVDAFAEKTKRLFQLPSCERFEGVDIIRYEPGQVLKPHFDANQGANVEDKERGGQVLVTVLAYLNDVNAGGRTRFGKIDLDIQPKQGECLVFFPADANGNFDEQTEHEGTEALDEKWLARIWVHQQPVRRGSVDPAMRSLEQARPLAGAAA